MRRVERGRMTGGGRTKEDGVKKRAKRVRRVRRDYMGIINTQAGYYLGSRGWRERLWGYDGLVSGLYAGLSHCVARGDVKRTIIR